MPVECAIPIARLTRDEFITRDEIVMPCAYQSQNRLGRLCDERVYENDVASRLRAAGMREVYTQVPVTVRHGHFSKEYRLDLVADAAVYELKAVRQLVGEHDAQVLNYAMLLDISCIKLVNFRGARVMGRLRFSPVGIAARLGFRINSDGWKPLSAKCEAFKKAFLELINDLGAFLDTRLYEEALMALIPATEARLSVSADGRELGSHRTNMIAENVAFCVTAFSGPLTDHQSHLTRLLSCLPLRGLQWINLNHSEINLTTLIQGADT